MSINVSEENSSSIFEGRRLGRGKTVNIEGQNDHDKDFELISLV
jgi:hypothetical protein